MMKQHLLTPLLCFFFVLLFASFSTLAQSVTVKGIVQDANSGEAIEGVLVELNEYTAQTDATGAFQFKIPSSTEPVTISFSKVNFGTILKEITPDGQSSIDIGVVVLTFSQTGLQEDRIAIISLSDEDLEGDNFDENISGILSASQDVFVNAASFSLSSGRFRIRGYDSENHQIYLNGIPMNKLENGRAFWSLWGGLNDVTRNRETTLGLDAGSFTFGGVGGGTFVDTRASEQRKQKRVSYYFANRAYSHRVMGTWSTGMMPSGWAVSLSGSRRWAEEGYLPGTFYDAYSYFMSIDKKLGDNQLLNLTAFGAPSKRGRPGSSTAEVYDLVGDNYYNPYWGYHNGEKRTTRMADAHQPVVMLRHDWKVDDRQKVTTAASYQFGKFGNTALEWFEAPDPRPDYYRNLPSFFAQESAEVAAEVEQNFRNNPDLLQINWQELYDANGGNDRQFFDTEGQFSQYILEERRFDTKEFNVNTNYENNISDEATLRFGLSYQNYRGENFKLVHDLLGGDYYVNIDKFALGDNLSPESIQFDLNDPDKVLKEGDRLGYDYDIDVQRYKAWGQTEFTFDKIDFFVAANISNTRFWRTGNFKNGRFPNSSLGESTKTTFTNFGVKGGVTYKINNRNYLYGNATYTTRAPFARNAYISPRTRDELVPNLTSEKIYGVEGGYQLRTPNVKARATAYFTRFEDQVDLTRFFVRGDVTSFGSYILNGVDKQHAGLELATEIKLSPAWTVSGVAALGNYQFKSEPNGLLVFDFNAEALDRGTVHMKDFYVPSTPQTGLSFSLEYRSAKFWFAEVTANYFNNFWIDFSPERRIADAVFGLNSSEDFYHEIVDQSKASSAVTVDFFGGKSWKFGRKFLYLTVGVTNVLNNQELVSGGFEQLSFDRASWEQSGTNLFPKRLYYAFGTNFFTMLALRF